MSNNSNALLVALDHLRSGRLVEAEALYREIIAEQPDTDLALYHLGLICNHTHRNEEAVELFRSAIARNVHVLEFHLNLGKTYVALDRLTEAQASYQHALALNQDSASTHFALAKLYDRIGTHRYWAQARTHLRRATELKPDWLEALSDLVVACGRIGPLEEAVEVCRRYVALKPDDAAMQYRLSENLAYLGHLTEAEEHLKEAVRLNPDIAPDARPDLEELLQIRQSSRTGGKSIRKARYPDTDGITQDLRGTIVRDVLGEFIGKAPFITKDTRFFAMGSCFAQNIANHLSAKGYQASVLSISDNINSTFANVKFIEWLNGTLTGGAVERIESLINRQNTREALLAQIRAADVFIYTLGVAPVFFDRETGDFVMPRPTALNTRAIAEKYEFRTTSVDENLENLLFIIDFIKRMNPNIRVVISLSPVPIHMTFEYDSAVIGDCISKSILRIVAHELLKKNIPNVLYWPSFEIVRWLGAHTAPVYGVDDGASWHVSEQLISMIVDLFVQTFAETDAST